MRKPHPIPTGGTIRFVSPANHVELKDISDATSTFESAGYKVQFGKHVFDRYQTYAGCDEHRASDIMEAFLDPEVDAVVCSRGGYGSARLIPYLDLEQIAASGKPFFGFSDVTSLHLAINRRGLATYYSPMGGSLGPSRPPCVRESLLRAFAGQDPLAVRCRPGDCVVPGKAIGISSGGCLTLVVDSLGTPDAVITEGRILFLEDVSEKPHRVDASLTHLLLAGKLQECAGIVIGEMTETNSLRDIEKGSPTWEEIVRERISPLGIPTIVNFPFGHIEDLLTIPLGVELELDADQGTIRMVS